MFECSDVNAAATASRLRTSAVIDRDALIAIGCGAHDRALVGAVAYDRRAVDGA